MWGEVLHIAIEKKRDGYVIPAISKVRAGLRWETMAKFDLKVMLGSVLVT
jgi:hypothetical protein